MNKKIKTVFCFIFSVLFSLSFVACSKGKTVPTNTNTGGVEEGGGGNGENPPEPQQEIQYVLTEQEANNIINNSKTEFDEFIENLNESVLLKNNNYDSGAGTKTPKILNFVYYPEYFKNHKNPTNVSLDTTYASRSASGVNNYFKTTTNGSNDKLEALWVNRDVANNIFIYLKFDFKINKGDVESLNVSYLELNNKNVEYAQALYNYKNLTLEIVSERFLILSEVELETFFKNNFMSDKFASISGVDWSWSFYEKFDFSSNKTYTCDFILNNRSSVAKTKFSMLGFIDAYDDLTAFETMTNTELKNYTVDQSLFVDMQNPIYSFDGEDKVFYKNN